MALLITITNAGRAEIINAQNTGTEKVTITAVAFGTGQYTPSKAQTALQAEVKRVGSIAGQAVAADTIHVMAMDESSAAYNVGEFGLISNKGTLIAVYSQLPAAGWIIQKAAPSTLLLATDIILESLDTSVIEFGDINFINPPATTEVAGVVRLANSLTSTSQSMALTAAMGKKLQDEKEPAIAAGTTSQYWRGNKTWRDFATDVRAAVLTGLSTSSAAAITTADTVLSALGKLQKQISDAAAAFAGNVRATALTGYLVGSNTALGSTDTVLGAFGKVQAQLDALASGKVNKAGDEMTGRLTAPLSHASGYLEIRPFGPTHDDGSGAYARLYYSSLNSQLVLNTSVGSTPVTLVAHSFSGRGGDLTELDAGALARGIVPDARLSGTYSGVNITGNAGTATKLQTARTINGVNFDGTANITVADDTKEPAFAAGTTAQYRRGDKTWRDFATDVRATLLTGLSTATATAMAAGDTLLVGLGKVQAQINALAAGKLDATANAVSATKLQTARTINGVSFDGTANITVADNTKLPLSGGTLTGLLEAPALSASLRHTTGYLDILPYGASHDDGSGAYARLYYSSLNNQLVLNTSLGSTPVTLVAHSFSGRGGALTELNAGALASGIVPDARLSGTYSGVNITGNAGTATKWATARTLTLAGDAAGAVSLDGSANATLTVKLPSEVGQVALFAMNAAPAGWLKANGAAVSRTTYAALFAAIGTTFGAGNGSTTFNLPDLRGEFLRGWDDGRGVDSGRAFGSAQAALSPDIPRDGWGTTGSAPNPSGSVAAGRLVVGSGAVENGEILESLRAAGNNATPLAGDNRPRNIALLACIKF